MTSQKAKFISGIWEWLFPEAKKFVDLLCEIIWVLQFDELNGAAAEREGWGETHGIFLRELLCQPVEQVIPQGFCQAHGNTGLGLFLGACAYFTSVPVHRKSKCLWFVLWALERFGTFQRVVESHWISGVFPWGNTYCRSLAMHP